MIALDLCVLPIRLAGPLFPVGLAFLLSTGCRPGAAPKTAPTAQAARSSDSRETFKKQVGPHAYRSALQQLNTTFGGADPKPAQLTEAQRQLLARDIGLDD